MSSNPLEDRRQNMDDNMKAPIPYSLLIALLWSPARPQPHRQSSYAPLISRNTAKLSSPILIQHTVAHDESASKPTPAPGSRSSSGTYLQTMPDHQNSSDNVRRRRSSSILQVYHEPPETLEQISDQAVVPNLNANWVNSKGAWTIHFVLIACTKLFLNLLPGMTSEVSWTLTNITYMFFSYIMFHHVRGIPFEFNGGAFDNLNMWEQIDDGAQYTPAKKFLLSTPIALFLLSTHYTHYDLLYFVINFVAVLCVIIPKLPFSHRMRISLFTAPDDE
ncbi:Protein ORM1 [Ceratocystis fimbriata CBS 114723]|uniref:Protein ORM1 n=3 Tax=Ceratocystis TaxID=5157 RepID=A0A2C5WWM3_9PEZI|nr:Protein ORM1 [Ceratocystis fimbriata CBS 114723]